MGSEWIMENYNQFSQFNQDLFIWGTKLLALIALTILHLYASHFLMHIYQNRLEIYINHFKRKEGTILYFRHKFILLPLILVCLGSFWTFDKFFVDDGKWGDVFEVIIILNYCFPVALLLRFPQLDQLSNIPHRECNFLNLVSAFLSYLAFRSFPLIYSHIKDYF